MSLIQTITSRNPQDLINEGSKIALTGSVGNVTDQVLWTGSSTRAPIVMGYSVSTNNATPILVSLGFKNGSNTTNTFFTGYVASGESISREFALGDWYRGALGDGIVITTSGTPVAVTIDAKSTSFPAALGYIENWGAQAATAHSGRAWFPDPSGATRGQWDI